MERLIDTAGIKVKHETLDTITNKKMHAGGYCVSLFK